MSFPTLRFKVSKIVYASVEIHAVFLYQFKNSLKVVAEGRRIRNVLSDDSVADDTARF